MRDDAGGRKPKEKVLHVETTLFNQTGKEHPVLLVAIPLNPCQTTRKESRQEASQDQNTRRPLNLNAPCNTLSKGRESNSIKRMPSTMYDSQE